MDIEERLEKQNNLILHLWLDLPLDQPTIPLTRIISTQKNTNLPKISTN